MKTALIFDCYDDYAIRIRFIKEAMEAAGYSVHVFFSDFDHYAKKYVNGKHADVEYIHAQAYAKNLSYARIHSHLMFAKDCVKKAEEYSDAEVVYVMVPPNSMCRDFAAYHEKHSEVKLIFDVCDMWPESLPLNGTLKALASPLTHVWRSYRDKYIDAADCILSECHLFAQQIQPCITKNKLHTVYLCQEHHDSISHWDPDAVSFLYCGSINNIINIDLIASFLKKVSSQRQVIFHIIGNGEQKQQLIEKTSSSQIKVIDHGVVYEEAAKKEIYAQCQYGLNLMVDSVFVGLTMKSLDYMSHDLPLINNIKGDTWQLVATEQIGINLDAQSLEEAAEEIVQFSEENYNQLRNNVSRVFNTTFDVKIIRQQLDKILEDL